MGYLVTGARGFIGGHLLDRLRADGHQAHGISRGYGDDGRNQASHELTGDVRDQKQMQAILRQTRPDIIFHCAAQSYPGIAWKAPLDTFEANAVGTLSLLQSMIDVDLSPRVVICSSSAVYGSGNGRDPINESHALAPADPYGLSKVTQEEIGRYFVRNHSTDVVFARPFFVMGRKVNWNYWVGWPTVFVNVVVVVVHFPITYLWQLRAQHIEPELNLAFD